MAVKSNLNPSASLTPLMPSVLSDILDATGFHLDLDLDTDNSDDNSVIDPIVGTYNS